MQGHIRSIIPQRNGVSPVDNQTTFLAHFDEHANDSIQGISPIGNLNSFYFPATTGSCATGNNIGKIVKGQTSVTVSCLAKINSLPQAWSDIISFGSANMRFELTDTSKIAVFSIDSSATGVVGPTLVANQWYHLAFTHSGTNWALYVDGTLTNSGTAGSGFNASDHMYFAGRYDNSAMWQGCLSEVTLWKRALSAEEIVQLKNRSFKTGGSDLVGYWKFNEGIGTIAYDSSPTGNDVPITVGSWKEGDAIYTLTDEGYDGKGVLLEEGTVNLVSKPLDPSTWTINSNVDYGYISHSIIDTKFGIKGISKTIASVGNTYQGTLNTIPWGGSIDVNSSLTKSFYVRTDNPDGKAWVSLNFEGKDASGVRKDVSVNYTVDSKEWKRFSLTSILSSYGFATLNGYLKLYTYTTDGVARTIDFVMPQLEQKSLATSFVNGTRGNPNLHYPSSIINKNEGTISCWVKAIDHGSWRRIVSFVGATESVDGHADLQLDIGGSEEVRFRVFNQGTPIDVITSNGAIKNNEWNFVACTWGPNGISLYVNGQTWKNSTHTSGIGAVRPGGISIGKDGGRVFDILNGSIDELRIDKVARTEDEITAWYYQGRNGWR